MKILFTASECVPFIKTGGLADVVGALAPVLAKQGHDVRVMLPLYAAVPKQYVDQMTHVTDFEVALGWRRQYCGIELLEKDGVKFYFVDNKFYFGRPYIYGMGGDEYERFGFFCRAALNALPLLDFQPDVIHAHDWQSGMVPALLKIQYAHLPFFANIKTMFTIHNLQYQGVFGIREVQDVLGLGDSLWTDDKLECYGCANFMKAALVYSDIITTVSPSYAEEIQTAYYGERLDGLLRARKHEVFGVLNGIDMADYNPATDARIPAEYTADDLSGKAKCKAELQEKLGLTVDPNVPIIGMVGRLSSQKGLDLVDYIIGDLMSENVQLVVLGMGEILGLHLPENFRQPFFSASVKELWARWHISLSQWFRDYVYIPLGGNRKGIARRDANLLLTFLVSGLWHGANWTFLVWGGLHGLCQVAEDHMPAPLRKRKSLPLRIVGVPLTFAIFVTTFTIFRASSLGNAAAYFAGIHIGVGFCVARSDSDGQCESLE